MTNKKNKMNCKIKNLGDFNIPDTCYGDMELNMYPINKHGLLPIQFKAWENSLSQILKKIPTVKNEHRHEVMFEANNLYFMTSNTPHETLTIPKGERRTFMRVTLDRRYPTNEILND